MLASILDPNASLFGLGWMVDRGACSFGRLTDQRADESNGVYVVSWRKELMSGIEETDVAVLVFHDGQYIDKVVGRDYCFFVPMLDSPIDRVTLHLVPNHYLWPEHIDTPGLDCRVRLRWNISGHAYTENVLGNSGASITGDILDTFETPTVTPLFPTYSDKGLSTFGTWTGPWIDYDTITVTITSGGYVDEAAYSWAYHSETGTGICRAYAEHMLNGAMLQFEEGRYYSTGTVWLVRIGLPGDYTTKKFTPGGSYSFRVDSTNQGGTTTPGDSVKTVTINTPPAACSIVGTPTYTDGSGQIALTWRTPNESDITHYRIYQNRPGLGEYDVHWEWIVQGTVGAYATFNHTVTGLEPGYNRIAAVAIDSSGCEGKEVWYELELDASLNAITIPNPPEAIYGVGDPDAGDIAVTVWADDSSDTINLYLDDMTGSGDIDYTTLAGTIVNPQLSVFQELTGTISVASPGRYFIAARASSDGTEETNTDMVAMVVMDLAPVAPTALTAEVVAG